MKKILFVAAFIFSSLLAGCNPLTQYTISEQEINLALQKRNNFAQDIGLPGVAGASVTLSNLACRIGREAPGKVILTGDANLNMNSLLGSQNTTIKLTLSMLPAFNREKGAIYLQEMEVTDAAVTPEKMQTIVQTLMPWLSHSLRDYFDQQPAYILSENKSKAEALAKKYAKGIEIKPGEIVIPLTD